MADENGVQLVIAARRLVDALRGINRPLTVDELRVLDDVLEALLERINHGTRHPRGPQAF